MILTLLFAAILAVVSAGIAVRVIEARSLADLTQTLRMTGHEWASVSVDGLQVRLTGTAPSEAERFRALTAAGTIVDPARVQDQMDVAETVITAPRFSIEILRNEGDISLIGLVPAAVNREELLAEVKRLTGSQDVTDLLESADHPAPEGFDRATRFGLTALRALARSKISIAAEGVRISGISDSAQERARLETELTKAIPQGLKVALDISAPRPALTPFTLRFVKDADGRARFDACSADTAEARDLIIKAAVKAGVVGKVNCTLGLGAPSPRWGEAAARAIAAVDELGGGSVTISDADLSLLGLVNTPRDAFDAAVGGLERDLPDAFSLVANLPEPVVVDGTGEGHGPPEFIATRSPEGQVQLRGRIGTERDRTVVDGFAKAAFGVARVHNVTRLDEDLPDGWAVRALVGLDALSRLLSGSVVVQEAFVTVKGVTGNPETNAEISAMLAEKLGEGANFELEINYDKKLDPVLGLPTAEECVARINEVIAQHKISFAPGSIEIDAENAPTIDLIAQQMKNCEEFPIQIGGHTDSQGREEMNLDLSQSRAEAVLKALLDRRVLTSNLTALGFGESQPIADNKTEEGREANRRIEFRLRVAEEGAATEQEKANP